MNIEHTASFEWYWQEKNKRITCKANRKPVLTVAKYWFLWGSWGYKEIVNSQPDYPADE